MFISEDMTEWSASQGDWLMNDSQDEAIVVEGRWAEQQGGNLLFRAIRGPRRWHGGAANAERFQVRLRKLRVPADDLLGEAMAEAYRQGLEDGVRDRGFVPKEYMLRFAVHDNYYVHVWASSPVMPLTDWLRGNQSS